MSFADELARMHTACDGVFGVSALFKPAAGGSTACRVEKHAPAPAFGFGEAQAVTPDALLRVVKAGLPARPKVGDRFELVAADGVTVTEAWRVITAPSIEDDDGLRYTVQVEAAALTP